MSKTRRKIYIEIRNKQYIDRGIGLLPTSPAIQRPFRISLDEPLEVDAHAKIAITIDFIHGDNLSLF
jgi:hypothetical protein